MKLQLSIKVISKQIIVLTEKMERMSMSNFSVELFESVFLLVPNNLRRLGSESIIGLVVAQRCRTIIELIDLLINFYAVVVTVVMVVFGC
jgi:hypothetical protein